MEVGGINPLALVGLKAARQSQANMAQLVSSAAENAKQVAASNTPAGASAGGRGRIVDKMV